MGLEERSIVRTGAVDFGERERESAGLFAMISGSGKVMRERVSFGSWEAAHLNENNSKPRQHRKLCIFKKMLSQ